MLHNVLTNHISKNVEMNLFSLNSDDDLIGIAVDGNSMVLPTKELFEVVGSPSSELDNSVSEL